MFFDRGGLMSFELNSYFISHFYGKVRQISFGGKARQIFLMLHISAGSCPHKMILIWTDAQNQELSNGVSIARNGQKLSLIHRFEVATTPFFWVGLSIYFLHVVIEL